MAALLDVKASATSGPSRPPATLSVAAPGTPEPAPKIFHRIRTSLEQSLRTATRSKTTAAKPVIRDHLATSPGAGGMKRADNDDVSQSPLLIDPPRRPSIREESPSTRSQRPAYPNQQSNVKSLSPPANPEHRDFIRTATSMLCKEVAKPPLHMSRTEAGLKDWEEVEMRVRGLARLERSWERSGIGGSLSNLALSTPAGVSVGGEERERRLFTEALRDGFVLCQLMNKLRSGSIIQPDSRDDGFVRTSNITKFLAACSSYGLPNEDLFQRDDLIEATSESLARVASTIIALIKYVDAARGVRIKNSAPVERSTSFRFPTSLDNQGSTRNLPADTRAVKRLTKLPRSPLRPQTTSIKDRQNSLITSANHVSTHVAPGTSVTPPRSLVSVSSGMTRATTAATMSFETIQTFTTDATSAPSTRAHTLESSAESARLPGGRFDMEGISRSRPSSYDELGVTPMRSRVERTRNPGGRFDMEEISRRRPRPSSYDELGSKPMRSRFESMVNLGVASTNTSGNDLLSRDSLAGSFVRQALIIREEGKPPTHFQLGNCIGRGQFGSVYRALNLNTGQMVAVKRIRLEGLKEDEVTALMREVDLVKSLSHPSIVKYEGMARDQDTLSIVMEYTENGSLSQTLKAFGKLNERLVASYVVKILEGLHYLHSSDVVHGDLKAANILTTKNGNLKLSDFGVSLNVRVVEKDVGGIPNWMAPEVIELKGASPKSDIWSLACTVVELLTGRPPYAEIANSMSVMFRIVEDDTPPLPEGFSPLLEDFLTQCFNKDPTKRPSAELLCEHKWLRQNWAAHKELRPQDSIPFLRRLSADLQASDTVRFLEQIGMPDSAIEGNLELLSSSSSRRMSFSSRPMTQDISPREHSFVKTTFSKPMVCRVCLLNVRKSAVLCEQCSLIAHSKCAVDAPPTCDLRSQLQLYAQYTEKGNPRSTYSNPLDVLGEPQPASEVGYITHTPQKSLDGMAPGPSHDRLAPLAPPSAFKFMAAFERSRSDDSTVHESKCLDDPISQLALSKDEDLRQEEDSDLPVHSQSLPEEQSSQFLSHSINNNVPVAPQKLDGSDEMISTYVIYSPESFSPNTLPHHGPVAIQSEEFQILDKELSNGGSILSVHSPDEALSWIEAHYEDPLLNTMRTQGLVGPIAAMLSPDLPTLVVFGSILNGWVLKAAKLLADFSQFRVMIRPLTDDPLRKWSAANSTPDLPSQIHTSIHQDKADISEEENSEVEDGEDQDNMTSEEEMVSDTENLSNTDGVFRLRGGAQPRSEKYIPQKGPVHNLDIHLELQGHEAAPDAGTAHPSDHFPHKVSILCKLQFTVQSAYTDQSFNGYRPQAVSWTKFIVASSSRGVQVLCDRSYGSIGFLVHEGMYISRCMRLDCDGFIQPKNTAKIVQTKTTGFTSTAAVTGGMNTIGGAIFTINRTKANALEKQNDRVTPAWFVDYEDGDRWRTDEHSYWEQNVSFKQSEDDMNRQHGMDVEYSMGINVANTESGNPELPRISFITRNQTILWVPDKSLKSKGYGIIVLTSTYFPEIETINEVCMDERQIVELRGNSLTNIPQTDPAIKSSTPMSLSLAIAPTKDKPGILKRIANKLALKSLTRRKQTESQNIPTLPLYDFKARGWDATTERWRMPVYPRLDDTLCMAEKPGANFWILKRVDDANSGKQPRNKQHGPQIIEPEEDKERANLPNSNGKQCNHPGGNHDTGREIAGNEEDHELKNLAKSKGKQRDLGTEIVEPEENGEREILPKSKGKQRDPGPDIVEPLKAEGSQSLVLEEPDATNSFTGAGTSLLSSPGTTSPSTEEDSLEMSHFTSGSTSFTTSDTHTLAAPTGIQGYSELFKS